VILQEDAIATTHMLAVVNAAKSEDDEIPDGF